MAVEATSKTEIKDDNFKQYLQISITSLAWMGFKTDLNNPKVTGIHGVLEKILAILTLFVAVKALIILLLWIKNLKILDMELLIDMMTLLVSDVSVFAKMLINIEVIRSLFKELLDIWKEYKPHDDHRMEIVKIARRMMLCCKFYLFVACLLIWSFLFPPVQSILFQFLDREKLNYTFDYSVKIFILQYPYDIDNWTMYIITFVDELWVLIGTTLHWVACDILFMQLMTHVTLQLEVLKIDFGHLINDEINEDRLQRSIVIFVMRHRNLLRICDGIEKIFSPVIFTMMTFSSLDLCVNLYLLSSMRRNLSYVDYVIHIFLALAVLIEVTIYCSFAEMLTEKTESVAKAVYNTNWTNKNPKFKRSLHILISQSQNPFYCTALGLFRIDLTRLAWVYKTAMSFYMMLQATS